MFGLMQDWPLLVHRIIDHAAIQHGTQQVVTRSVEGPLHRTNYADIHRRSKQVAQRLVRDGIVAGDRVATLAWNTWRHVESWYGITGLGAIYHTVNPRLFPEQIAWIVNHAGDRMIFTDLTFLPLLEALAGRLPTLERIVVLTDAAHMPATKLANVVAYEDWIAEADGDFEWAEFDERTAAGLCYTSGTTGNPKGVLYSHRSNVLHSMSLCNRDALDIGSKSVVMPIVPLFHANAWSLVFSVPMMGARLVLPGPRLDGASVYDLMETQGVTVTAGVPTIWLMLVEYMQKEHKQFSIKPRLIVGGSACPRTLMETFERQFGAEVFHAWGMTEMSPVGSLGSLKPCVEDLEGEARYDLKVKQGFAPFGVEMKITDDAGEAMPWDGKAFGHLKVAGFAVAKAYYGLDEPILDADGFFDTGDIATIDHNGYMQITDRAKDVIKSGGEWISSIEIENLALGFPDVAEAAVIGVAHTKWHERPLLVVVAKQGCSIDRDALLSFLAGKIPTWWMPDDAQVVAEIPHTATGKINKLRLRQDFRDYHLPTDR